MRIQQHARILLLASLSCSAVVAFQTVVFPSCRAISSSTSLWASSSAASTKKKSTLTEDTVWKLSIVLRSVETQQGKKVNDMLTLEVNFIEEDGYEPPQGKVQQVLRGGDKQDRLVISSGRWKLSEDPKDRKDGLWVWGLFKEPLYPFMLLQMETQAIPLPGTRGIIKSNNNDDEKSDSSSSSTGDGIKPLTLYAQINHKRDDKLGVVLEAGSDLNVRQVETVKADPFGAAEVDLYQDVSVGTITIQPISITN
jgi:hypothetical protein